ncbi:hypothetical protein KC329_g110 [Hortaea werneckii]|nr:hypothetical protein KC329_g110 [Hortaea werneckii]
MTRRNAKTNAVVVSSSSHGIDPMLSSRRTLGLCPWRQQARGLAHLPWPVDLRIRCETHCITRGTLPGAIATCRGYQFALHHRDYHAIPNKCML